MGYLVQVDGPDGERGRVVAEGAELTILRERRDAVFLPYEDELGFVRRDWGHGAVVDNPAPRRYAPLAMVVVRNFECVLTVNWATEVEIRGPSSGAFDLVPDARTSQIRWVRALSSQVRLLGGLMSTLGMPDVRGTVSRGSFEVQHPGGGACILSLCMWAHGSGYAFRWVAATVKGK